MAASKVKNTLKYLAFAVLAFALLFMAFHNTDPAKLLSDLKHANYSWVLLSIAIGYSSHISRAYRWRLLMEPMGYHPGFWNTVHSTFTLYFVNLALPRAGEVARCTSLNQVENIPVNKLFGTVLIERSIDFVMLFIVMSIAAFLNIDRFYQLFDLAFSNQQEVQSSDFKFYILGFFLLIALLGLAFRKKIIAHPKFNSVRNFYHGLKEGFQSIFKMKRQGAFWLHSIYIWACYFLMVYVCFFSIEPTAHLTIADGFFIMVAASLGIVIPVPGGIGAYHYLVSLALTVLGLQLEEGLTFATIVHSSQTLMLFTAGSVAAIALSLKRRRLKQNVEA